MNNSVMVILAVIFWW